jgi:cytochrome c
MKAFAMFRAAFLGLVISLSASVFAADHADPLKAKIMLDRAAEEVQKNPSKAFATFNDPKGGFIEGELYVFVIDTAGKYMASGGNPKLTGTSALNTRDAAGKPLFQEMIEVTKTKPEALVAYTWLNRATNKVEPKRTFVKRVGNYIVGVGYYLG